MRQPLPTFLVAGAARSGTTGLVEGLRKHPDVFVTHPKEPHYFALHGTEVNFCGPGDDHTINRVAVTDLDDYFALYSTSHSYKARGDGSVSTMYYYQRALPEILRVNPEMRLVILLREPVARAYSSFQYMRARGFEPMDDFLEALAAEPARRRAGYHHLWHYTKMSFYADSLTAMHEALGDARLGVWFHDELEYDFTGTIAEVLRFLGVAHVTERQGSIPRVNISGDPRSKVFQRTIWRATGNDAMRRAVKLLTTYRFRERVRRLALRPSAVSAEALENLRPVFDDDLGRVLAVLERLPNRRSVPGWLASAALRSGLRE